MQQQTDDDMQRFMYTYKKGIYVWGECVCIIVHFRGLHLLDLMARTNFVVEGGGGGENVI